MLFPALADTGFIQAPEKKNRRKKKEISEQVSLSFLPWFLSLSFFTYCWAAPAV